VAGGSQVVRHFVAHQLEEDQLAAYFKERHQQHEVLRLIRVELNGWDGGRGLVQISGIRFTRSADDLPVPGQGYSGDGKASFFCEKHRFEVMSLQTNLP
jgi:hypothetical protein